MKKIYTPLFFLILIFSSSNYSFAQKQTNNWYFGTLAGLDFNSGSPVPLLNGALNTSEGCSSMSDADGNLLFYTDGITVWNKNHQQMLNGDNLTGDVSSSQSALIVPQPGKPDIYYVFTVDADGGSDGFRYSIIDMTLDTGRGAVTSAKNILIKSNVTEKLSAVWHPGNGIWVMIHEWGSDAFYNYDLNSSGLNLTPIISHTGTLHSTSVIQNTYGQMKFSPGAKKLALAIGYQSLFELFDFNDTTGIVSNPISLPVASTDHCYGLEFSLSGDRLYTNHYDNVSDYYYLDQYDLTAGNAAAINASVVNLSTTYDGVSDPIRGMQVASDGKIYVAKGFNGALSVINSPDSLGIACNYSNSTVSLGGNTGGLTLPGFPQTYFQQNVPPLADLGTRSTILCGQSCLQFSDLSINAPSSWSWSFSGATPDTSLAQHPPMVCYTTPGNHDVTLIVNNAFGSDTITRTYNVQIGNAVVAGNVTAARDTICSGTPGFLSASGNSVPVQWQSSLTATGFNSIAGADSVEFSDIPSQNTYYRVFVTNGICSDTSNVFKLVVMPSPVADYYCSSIGLNVSFNSSGSSSDVTSYDWDFGDSTHSTIPNPTHTFNPSDTFHVCLTVKNGSNCSYTICRDIDCFTGITSIAKQSDWSIYPLPFSDNLFINTDKRNKPVESVIIYDVLGRIIFIKSYEANHNPIQIELSDLAQGMYYLKLKIKDSNYFQPIIKQ